MYKINTINTINRLKKINSSVLVSFSISIFSMVVGFAAPNLLAANSDAEEYKRLIEIDSNVVTKHKTTINKKSVSYSATTGTQLVWDSNGDPDRPGGGQAIE